MEKEKEGGGGRQKGCERLTSMRTIIGERKPNDRYDVRTRDCHATDAHVSYGKLCKGTSGGASNLLAKRRPRAHLRRLIIGIYKPSSIV